jgi:hypothetical protein
MKTLSLLLAVLLPLLAACTPSTPRSSSAALRPGEGEVKVRVTYGADGWPVSIEAISATGQPFPADSQEALFTAIRQRKMPHLAGHTIYQKIRYQKGKPQDKTPARLTAADALR